MQTRKVRGTKGKKQKEAITVAGTAGVIVVGPTGVPLAGVLRNPDASVTRRFTVRVPAGGRIVFRGSASFLAADDRRIG